MADSARLRLPTAIWRLLHAGGVIAATATLLGYAGRNWWFFELFSHLRVQYFVVLCLIVAVFAVARRLRASVCYAVFALINLYPLLPYYLAPTDVNAMPETQIMRAVSINVSFNNRQYDLVARFVRENRPDFVLLAEADSNWLNGLSELRALYPYSVKSTRDDIFSIALLSRHELLDSEIIDLGDTRIPAIKTRLRHGSRELTIIGVHLVPPVNRQRASLRNRQLAALPRLVKETDGLTVLMGDFNATPWSPYFRRLLYATGLRDSSYGKGLHPTWPARFFPLWMPIDHFLVSATIEVIDKSVGPHVGSDHYPILMNFAL